MRTLRTGLPSPPTLPLKSTDINLGFPTQPFLEEEMTTHSSVLAWRTPGTEEPGGPQTVGSQGRTRPSDRSPAPPLRPLVSALRTAARAIPQGKSPSDVTQFETFQWLSLLLQIKTKAGGSVWEAVRPSPPHSPCSGEEGLTSFISASPSDPSRLMASAPGLDSPGWYRVSAVLRAFPRGLHSSPPFRSSAGRLPGRHFLTPRAEWPPSPRYYQSPCSATRFSQVAFTPFLEYYRICFFLIVWALPKCKFHEGMFMKWINDPTSTKP